MMYMNLNDISFLKINVSDYRCIISLISKNEVINLNELQNHDGKIFLCPPQKLAKRKQTC